MSLDSVTIILAILLLLAIPTLDILAFRLWKKALRRELPEWRSRLGLTSIVLIFLAWYGAILLPLFIGFVDWIGLLLALLALGGTILGFTLKGASRMEAIAAGLLTLVGMVYSVVS